jgi:hypothetical protein
MKKTIFLSLILGLWLLTGCGKSAEQLKKEKEEATKAQATQAVKDFFEDLGKQAFEKIKPSIDPASQANWQILVADAQKYQAENNIREPIVVEVIEAVIIAPDKVNCKTRCKIKDKEVIEVIPVIIVKEKECRISVLPVHLSILRFVVFCNRYDLIVIEYNKKHYQFKKKKKKKNHPRGKAHGYHRNNDDDDDD